MSSDRRKFLKATGLLASGLIAGAHHARAWMPFAGETAAAASRLKQFGLQLYSLRDDMPKDPRGVLKQVASFGYKQIESYEGPKGMFWGMSNTEFKKYMDELGMTIISSHCNIGSDFEKKAAQAGEIGMKHLICPAIGPQKSLDDYKKFADRFNACGDICKKYGLRFAYHNHGYTFQELNGVMPQDVLMQNTNPDTVDFQMDIYWVVTPGADPIEWINKYPNRFVTCHVKDRAKDAKGDDASCDLGTGSIDLVKIMKAAQKKGMKYFVVEQEKYENSTPLKSVEADAAWMKQVKL
jgi:sugar phosphate isomerase/epimerase